MFTLVVTFRPRKKLNYWIYKYFEDTVLHFVGRKSACFQRLKINFEKPVASNITNRTAICDTQKDGATRCILGRSTN